MFEIYLNLVDQETYPCVISATYPLFRFVNFTHVPHISGYVNGDLNMRVPRRLSKCHLVIMGVVFFKLSAQSFSQPRQLAMLQLSRGAQLSVRIFHINTHKQFYLAGVLRNCTHNPPGGCTSRCTTGLLAEIIFLCSTDLSLTGVFWKIVGMEF